MLILVVLCSGTVIDTVLRSGNARLFASLSGYRGVKVVERENNQAEIHAFSLDAKGSEVSSWRATIEQPDLIAVGESGQALVFYDGKSESAIQFVSSAGQLGARVRLDSMFSGLEKALHFRESVSHVLWRHKIKQISFSGNTSRIEMSWGRVIQVCTCGLCE